jgi:acylphosphatase
VEPRRCESLDAFVGASVHWHCIARGRVQGVNYRARVAEAAHRHGVVGTVANRADGTVFIDVQGEVVAVEAFLRDVSGPRGASHAHAVERVAEVAIAPDLDGFEIVRE